MCTVALNPVADAWPSGRLVLSYVGGVTISRRGCPVARPQLLGEVRRKRILYTLRARGPVGMAEVTQQLRVSEMTIRRDLDKLERDGWLERTHGGAVLTRMRGATGHKQKAFRKEDASIAAVAAGLVERGATIARCAGSATLALARALAGIDEISVATNSVDIWKEFVARRAGGSTILTGGEEEVAPSGALVGPSANATIRSLYFDIVFIGVDGMDPLVGLTNHNPSEAETNRAFLSRGRSMVVVADHRKWGVAALCTVAELTDIDVLVADDGLPVGARGDLNGRVGKLLIAPSGSSRGRGPLSERWRGAAGSTRSSPCLGGRAVRR
jgi:DeoR/GlpR family transcriptional regulator of sugar metabolism